MSRKPEQQMWVALRPYMVHLHPVRIESHMRAGVADVNYTHGWMELKQLASWPKRAKTSVKVDHFTEEQRNFLTARCRAGGRAYLMLRVNLVDWLLFNGAQASNLIGGAGRPGVCRESLCQAALRHWHGVPRRDDLTRVICP